MQNRVAIQKRNQDRVWAEPKCQVRSRAERGEKKEFWETIN